MDEGQFECRHNPIISGSTPQDHLVTESRLRHEMGRQSLQAIEEPNAVAVFLVDPQGRQNRTGRDIIDTRHLRLNATTPSLILTLAQKQD